MTFWGFWRFFRDRLLDKGKGKRNEKDEKEAVGRINLPEVAESILEEGKPHLIAMHRLGKAKRNGHLRTRRRVRP
jgi:hypothetical protein